MDNRDGRSVDRADTRHTPLLNDRSIHVRADEPTTRACEAAYLKAPPWLAERTVLLIRAGSHANGLALPTSDIDLRGAAIAPRPSYFGFLHRFEGFECKEPDCAVSDIRFFMRAASEGDLNALQVLFCDERDLLVCRPAGMTLRQMRASFISKRVVKPFAGFARGQIEKVRRRLESCMMDVYGGGFLPASGNVVASMPPVVTVMADAVVETNVKLDFALP